jgi:hypothetical protein
MTSRHDATRKDFEGVTVKAAVRADEEWQTGMEIIVVVKPRG